MPHIHDESRWEFNSDGSRYRVVGRRPGKGPDATEGALELAASYGLDLSEVTGTGSGGRITKADVEAFLDEDDD